MWWGRRFLCARLVAVGGRIVLLPHTRSSRKSLYRWAISPSRRYVCSGSQAEVPRRRLDVRSWVNSRSNHGNSGPSMPAPTIHQHWRPTPLPSLSRCCAQWTDGFPIPRVKGGRQQSAVLPSPHRRVWALWLQTRAGVHGSVSGGLRRCCPSAPNFTIPGPFVPRRLRRLACIQRAGSVLLNVVG